MEAVKASAQGPLRIPASLSHVLYIQGDLLGQGLAYLTLSPIYIGCYYLTLILSRRDLQTMLICVGQLTGVLINFVLKRVIREPRPTDLLPDVDDFGMPSNHAQFIGYFCGIYSLYISRIPSKKLSGSLKCIYLASLQLYGFLVCYSRFYLKYHTQAQVVWGYCIGLLLSIVWYLLIQKTSSLVRRLIEIPFIKFWFEYLKIRNYDNVDYAAVEEIYVYKNDKDN
jgi:dolichyldiphosphatase